MMDPISLITGAGILATGWLLGRLAPARRKETKQPKPEQPQAICGCDHHLAKHDPLTGRCHFVKAVFSNASEVVKDRNGTPVRDPYGFVHTINSRKQTGDNRVRMPTLHRPRTTHDVLQPRADGGCRCRDREGIDMTQVPYLIELRGGGVNDGKRHEWRGQLPEIVRYPEPPSATAAGVESMLAMAEPSPYPGAEGPKIACYRRSDHVTDEGYRIYDFERYEGST